MNRKGKEIEKKINDCKNIPVDYFKSIETQTLYYKK